MFLFGILCGCVATVVALLSYGRWYMPRAQTDIDSTIKEALERVTGNPKWDRQVREMLLKHKDQIEFEAIERLKHAMDRAERTGQPVRIELAGIEEYIYVSPPPGLKKEDPN